MKGLKIGHATNEKNATGASIFIFDEPAIASYQLCGSSPATVELNTIALGANVTHIDALTFLGGSAFGLEANGGVLRFLREQKRGWQTPHGNIPIVPAAAIYDLGVGSDKPPTADEVYQACQTASEDNMQSGRVGAATGASIGKLFNVASRMSGGFGIAEVKLPNGVQVMAFAVVNSVGDVLTKRGDILAGAKLSTGEFANCHKALLAGFDERRMQSTNTTLVAIITNAKFTKAELNRIAKMAVAGMGRAISPIFTRYDGDIIFAVSLEEKEASEIVVGTAAAQVTQEAIMNAVIDSVVL